jgi:hypothetical protein
LITPTTPVRPMDVEQQFGMFVEIAPDRGQFGQHLGEAVLDGHGSDLLRG